MSRNRVGVEEPGCSTRIVPPCSTMKSRFEASPALATKTGLESPVETSGWSWMAPAGTGEKARMAATNRLLAFQEFVTRYSFAETMKCVALAKVARTEGGSNDPRRRRATRPHPRDLMAPPRIAAGSCLGLFFLLESPEFR